MMQLPAGRQLHAMAGSGIIEDALAQLQHRHRLPLVVQHRDAEHAQALGVDIADRNQEMSIACPGVLSPSRDAETLLSLGVDGSSTLAVSCSRTW